MAIKKTKKLKYLFGEKHKQYMRRCTKCIINVAEGAVRAGKTVDNVFTFAYELERSPDKIHLATGSTIGNAKLNIGDCNGLGLEYIFRGRCKWGKYKGNECLTVKAKTGVKIIIFAGGAKADSYKKIRGNSYGMWIATEINLHHDNTIKEAFNRQLAARRRKVFWDLNPDNPNSFIYQEYIDSYALKQKNGDFIGGYNYEHFTIRDNITVSEDRIKEIESQYDKNSIWYRRDILGERCVADGNIYTLYANTPELFYIDKNKLPKKKSKVPDKKDIYLFERINIGVDFGGNGSAHSMVATAFSKDYETMYVLASRRVNAKGVTVEKIIDEIISFTNQIHETYGDIHRIYPDNAEQTIINSLKAKSPYRVHGSRKYPINDRIRCTDIMLSSGRLFLVSGNNEALDEALKTAVWDKSVPGEDIRLDDGSSDIDTLDAFEYSFERVMYKLMKYKTPKEDEE